MQPISQCLQSGRTFWRFSKIRVTKFRVLNTHSPHVQIIIFGSQPVNSRKGRWNVGGHFRAHSCDALKSESTCEKLHLLLESELIDAGRVVCAKNWRLGFAAFSRNLLVMLCFRRFAVMRTCMYPYLIDKPQGRSSRISSQIVLLGYLFHAVRIFSPHSNAVECAVTSLFDKDLFSCDPNTERPEAGNMQPEYTKNINKLSASSIHCTHM